ncbi:hydroxyethylthiazole kinase [Natranaeroarchaeum sulfidigenes]|uniref:Hydroxyethylthiazole kinase n=1 Tax=Natranaeroarchaeum sulfidigenes TaxID=2784880 RepID=A0A897MQ46_9EURY|nr:hydroxyethylthiazole kinase [Natranaeroarchaeum sulfidigenes]QSG02552.1 Hydroxyethylthiazole kinase, sugar kinase family [Natranaeroarchaeum sulfidigenes]
MTVDLDDALAAVEDGSPLVNAVTNNVTVNDVAQIILHWGGLPVMSDDEREVGDMVAAAQGCLLNMGTVSEEGEATMIEAGESANENGVPVVLDPVGVGATPTRDRVAERLASELDVAAIKGNYGEITALTGEDADVRGVESVGEYSDIATTAIACAQQYDTVVVASGETDVVATDQGAYEITAGHPDMGTVVGTGCMLGASVATFAGAIEDAEEATLAATVAFGLAGEAAASGAFGDVHGPGSYNVAFKDAVAGLRDAEYEPAAERVKQVLSADT